MLSKEAGLSRLNDERNWKWFEGSEGRGWKERT